jgi:hypothetical protein
MDLIVAVPTKEDALVQFGTNIVPRTGHLAYREIFASGVDVVKLEGPDASTVATGEATSTFVGDCLQFQASPPVNHGLSGSLVSEYLEGAALKAVASSVEIPHVAVVCDYPAWKGRPALDTSRHVEPPRIAYTQTVIVRVSKFNSWVAQLVEQRTVEKAACVCEGT